MRRGITAALLAAVLTAAPAAPAAVGDLLVAENSVPYKLVRIDAAGTQSIASEGGLLDTPGGVAISHFGQALVSNQDGLAGTCPEFDGCGGVISIDPETGAQAKVVDNASSASFGGPELFVDPLGVAVAANGNLIITDRGLQIGNTLDGRVITYNPRTGRQRLLAEGVNLRNPFGIVIRSSGEILVSDASLGPGMVIEIDPLTGTQAIFAQAGLLSDPRGLAAYPSRTVYVADQVAGAVIRIRPGGAQSVASSGGDLARPYGLARLTSGRLAVSDWNNGGPGLVLRVDPFTNSQAPFVSGGNLANNLGAAVIPPRCGRRLATIYGTPRPDTIRATRYPDVVSGLAGADRIVGLEGRDLICGGPGNDQISAGEGRDALFGGPGGDRLLGGPRPDRCFGGPGTDREIGC